MFLKIVRSLTQNSAPENLLTGSKKLIAGVVIVNALFLSGCDSADVGNLQNEKSYAVAIIDVDQVVNATNLRNKIESAVTERQQLLQKQLDDVQKTLQTQYDAKRQSYGDSPTAAQNNELATFLSNLNAQFDQNRDDLNTQLARFRQEMNQRTVSEIRPIAQAVAAKIGANIVLHQNNDTVLSATKSVTITDDVISVINGDS